jgi:hypothetical protein
MREYLFEQAKQQHELLSRSKINLNECTVKLSDYSEKIRAEILVNHLYFYGVDAEVCSRFVENGTARATLVHRNYNPRIVETMCELQQTSNLDPDAFCREFLRILNSPEQIWSHAFQKQLTSNARLLLLTFAIMGNSTAVDALRSEFRILAKHIDVNLVGFDALFNSCLEELENSFISIMPNVRLSFITYHTPSIKDFTDQQLTREDHFLQLVLKHCTYDETLLNAAKLLSKGQSVSLNKEALLDALRRGNFSESFRVELRDRFYVGQVPANRAQTLLSWLRTISLLNDDTLIKEALKCVENFIRSSEPYRHTVNAMVELYTNYLLLTDLANANLPLLEFSELMAEHCFDPDDFLSLDRGLEGCDGCEEIRGTLNDCFPERVYD